MIVIPKILLFVMMTTAAAVAADSSKLAMEEEKSLSDNEERATTTTTTTTPNGFAALALPSSSSASASSSSSSSSSSSLVEVSGADGGDISAPRKLSKLSKKVQHHEALCTLSLFADSLFMYANRCFTDIMVTIASCDDKDEMCYISERLPLLPQEQEENQEEEQCFVGGLFPAKKNIRYNPTTGDCEFLYVDLTDDLCNLYTGDTGTGSLGLKARINVKNNPDVMLIQFTNDKGLTFYNHDDERVAKRSIDRYLRQEGETKPVLSMMPHPFLIRHRRMRDRDKECNALIFNEDLDVLVGTDMKCNPSSVNVCRAPDCADSDCADPVWEDGCKGCMCFNHGNAAWCDGFQGAYYDTYFDQHGRNPWGDTIRANRKCNRVFRPLTSKCDAKWHCAKGYECYELSEGGGGGGANCSRKICSSSGRR